MTRNYHHPRLHNSIISIASGYTLLEIMMVMVVLSIGALIVSIGSTPSTHPKVDLAAEEIASAFRFARDEALVRSVPVGVLTETSIPRLRVAQDPTSSDPVVPVFDVYKPVVKQIFTLDYSTSLPGASITASTNWSGICSQTEYVFFDNFGRPRCANPWAVLLVDGTLTLSWSGVTKVVRIDGETGRVTVQ